MQIDKLLVDIEDKNCIYPGMLGDRAWSNDIINWFLITPGYRMDGSFNHPPLKRLPGVRGLFFRDQAYYMYMRNRHVRAAKYPIKGLEIARKISKEIDNMSSYYLLSNIMVSSFTRSFELQLKHYAKTRSARTAMAIERYRLVHNKFPEKLYQLVPDYLDNVPLDPFDKKTLRYRIDEDAVIVYSIGEDGKDDGGDVEYRTTKERPSDWGFVLLDPTYRNLPPEEDVPTTQTTQAVQTKPAPHQ
ncbi:MAG: hypothetical protein JSV03_14085 [Planctomycetota bacterium]|nr:MAG: hypothetical protein JSV03_14085 [Planctomycetota bacterium]